MFGFRPLSTAPLSDLPKIDKVVYLAGVSATGAANHDQVNIEEDLNSAVAVGSARNVTVDAEANIALVGVSGINAAGSVSALTFNSLNRIRFIYLAPQDIDRTVYIENDNRTVYLSSPIIDRTVYVNSITATVYLAPEHVDRTVYVENDSRIIYLSDNIVDRTVTIPHENRTVYLSSEDDNRTITVPYENRTVLIAPQEIRRTILIAA